MRLAHGVRASRSFTHVETVFVRGTLAGDVAVVASGLQRLPEGTSSKPYLQTNHPKGNVTGTGSRRNSCMPIPATLRW